MSKQLLLATFLYLFSLSANAEFMYVQSFKVRVQVEPSFNSMSVFYVKKVIGCKFWKSEDAGCWCPMAGKVAG